MANERVNMQRSEKGLVKIQDVLSTTLEKIDKAALSKKDVSGLSTGYRELDKITSGLKEGELVVLAARPFIGKTTLALNIARHISVDLKEPVGYFCPKMSREQITECIICDQTHLDVRKLRKGEINNEDYQRLVNTVEPLCEAELYIDDSPGISVSQIRTEAHCLKAEKELKVIFVDYLQLIRGDGKSKSGKEELSENCRALKELASELKITVVVLAQLDRTVEKRDDRRPVLSDLPGTIEASADMVIFIYRDDYYSDNTENKNVAEITVAKNRTGPTGSLKLYFIEQFVKFANIDE